MRQKAQPTRRGISLTFYKLCQYGNNEQSGASYISILQIIKIMFTFEEFKVALEAYEKETTSSTSEAFTRLRKEKNFFSDVKSKEELEKQIREFISIISSMNRDSYASRYVAQIFLLDFCRYLDKDFLFYITDHKTFLELRAAIKDFTGEVYETYKRFTQNIALHSLEHLLEDYALLLKFSARGFSSGKEEREEKVIKEESESKAESRPESKAEEQQSFTTFWDEGKLW